VTSSILQNPDTRFIHKAGRRSVQLAAKALLQLDRRTRKFESLLFERSVLYKERRIKFKVQVP